MRNVGESAVASLIATLHARAYGGYRAYGHVDALLRDVHAHENARLLLLNHADERGHYVCDCVRGM